MRNTLERGAPASFRTSVAAFLCRPGTILKVYDSNGDDVIPEEQKASDSTYPPVTNWEHLPERVREMYC